VRYQDIRLRTHEEELDGIKSRIFQHEFDHLDGVLFIDKISILKRKILNSRLNKIKRLSKIQKNQIYADTL
jgi:peptide deformylase